MSPTLTGFGHLVARFSVCLVAVMALSACVFSIGGGSHRDYDDDESDSSVTVTLPDGEDFTIKCPDGYAAYAKSDEDGAIDYGCKRQLVD